MRPRLAGSVPPRRSAPRACLFTMEGRIREPAVREKPALPAGLPGAPGPRHTAGPLDRTSEPTGRTSPRRTPGRVPPRASARTPRAVPTGPPDDAAATAAGTG